MKIVKFKDNTFGVRDGNFLTGYTFLASVHPTLSNYEFIIPENIIRFDMHYRFTTYEDAREALSNIVKRFDYGKPIKKGFRTDEP